MNARRSISWRQLVTLAAFFATTAGAAQALAESQASSRIARGKELFVRAWSRHDEKSPKGDGLGPLYNADSCVACHAQGGIGGAGPNGVNVQLLSVTRVAQSSSSSESVQARLQKIHPSFVSPAGALNPTIVLHRHSTRRGYNVWREDLLSMTNQGQREIDPLLRLFPVQALTMFITRERQHSPRSMPLAIDGLEFEVTERNTPAIFGASLINGMSEGFLRRVASRQAQEYPGITGRVPRSIDGRLGRFGWRGQISTLQDFVQNACAIELGLQLPSRLQAESPPSATSELFAVAAEHKKGTPPPHVDMDPGAVMDLMAFVTSLSRPKQTKLRMPSDAEESSGGKIFNAVGCAACHMRKIGKIDGLYSDLLLHDMGPDLSDPAAAIAEGSSFSTGGYYGGGGVPTIRVSDSLATLRREWRTPPLWGLRDSGPYLHDGRAATLDEAIRAHGGEAEAVAKKYRELTGMERESMLTFLATLAAP
jgi:CxxC motif-containing protein (DUF1111 family)